MVGNARAFCFRFQSRVVAYKCLNTPQPFLAIKREINPAILLHATWYFNLTTPGPLLSPGQQPGEIGDRINTGCRHPRLAAGHIRVGLNGFSDFFFILICFVEEGVYLFEIYFGGMVDRRLNCRYKKDPFSGFLRGRRIFGITTFPCVIKLIKKIIFESNQMSASTALTLEMNILRE